VETAATAPFTFDAPAGSAPTVRVAPRVERQPSAPAAPPRPAEIRPLSPTRYSLRVTLSADAHANLRRAQDLLRHAVPGGDPSVVVERALALLVEHLDRTKFAARIRQGGPAPSKSRVDAKHEGGAQRSRHIPASVRRAVWARDGGQCAFVGTGNRCAARGFLEFHHRVPFAEGGESTAENIELRCKAHNLHEARRWFGEDEPWLRESGRTGGEPPELETRPGPS
jgi:hypothetical protein